MCLLGDTLAFLRIRQACTWVWFSSQAQTLTSVVSGDRERLIKALSEAPPCQVWSINSRRSLCHTNQCLGGWLCFLTETFTYPCLIVVCWQDSRNTGNSLCWNGGRGGEGRADNKKRPLRSSSCIPSRRWHRAGWGTRQEAALGWVRSYIHWDAEYTTMSVFWMGKLCLLQRKELGFYGNDTVMVHFNGITSRGTTHHGPPTSCPLDPITSPYLVKSSLIFPQSSTPP